jgi:hypothetical protein
MSLFFFFGFVVSITVQLKYLYNQITLPLYGGLFLISGVSLIKYTKQSFLISAITLILIILETTIHRFFFITKQTFDIINLQNILLFGIPLILTLLLKRMPSDNKSQSNRSS